MDIHLPKNDPQRNSHKKGLLPETPSNYFSRSENIRKHPLSYGKNGRKSIQKPIKKEAKPGMFLAALFLIFLLLPCKRLGSGFSSSFVVQGRS